jgi:hypothetical protein
LVAALATVSLAAEGAPLDNVLYQADSRLMKSLHSDPGAYVPGWLWNWLLNPLLQRPAWLIPAAMALIFAGLALTFMPHLRRGGGKA